MKVRGVWGLGTNNKNWSSSKKDTISNSNKKTAALFQWISNKAKRSTAPNIQIKTRHITARKNIVTLAGTQNSSWSVCTDMFSSVTKLTVSSPPWNGLYKGEFPHWCWGGERGLGWVLVIIPLVSERYTIYLWVHLSESWGGLLERISICT